MAFFCGYEVTLAVVKGVEIIESAKIINDRDDSTHPGAAVLFPAQPATNHLHISDRAKDLPCDQHHVRLGCIETRG